MLLNEIQLKTKVRNNTYNRRQAAIRRAKKAHSLELKSLSFKEKAYSFKMVSYTGGYFKTGCNMLFILN